MTSLFRISDVLKDTSISYCIISFKIQGFGFVCVILCLSRGRTCCYTIITKSTRKYSSTSRVLRQNPSTCSSTVKFRKMVLEYRWYSSTTELYRDRHSDPRQAWTKLMAQTQGRQQKLCLLIENSSTQLFSRIFKYFAFLFIKVELVLCIKLFQNCLKVESHHHYFEVIVGLCRLSINKNTNCVLFI